MGVLRDWLMTVITVSVIIAGAQSLMPRGGVRQVGQLVCGLVLLCVLARPLCAVSEVSVVEILEEYAEHVRVREGELELQAGQTRKSVIEEYCGTYILDQAAQMGISCEVKVECSMSGDGLWLPHSAELRGDFDAVTQSRLTELLERDLGIPVEEQTYYLN